MRRAAPHVATPQPSTPGRAPPVVARRRGRSGWRPAGRRVRRRAVGLGRRSLARSSYPLAVGPRIRTRSRVRSGARPQARCHVHAAGHARQDQGEAPGPGADTPSALPGPPRQGRPPRAGRAASGRGGRARARLPIRTPLRCLARSCRRCALSAWSCTTARHIGGAGSMAVADIASMPGGPPPGRPGPALAPRRHGVAVASALPAGTRRRHRAPVPDHCRIAAPQPGHVPAQARREPPDPYARRHATPAAPVRCPHPQRPITAARFALSRRERPGVRRRRVAPGPRSRGAVAAIGLATNRRCATPCPMAPTTTALKDSPPGKARRVRTLVVGGPRTVTGRRVASDPKGSLPPWRCRRWQPSCGTAPRCVNAEAWGIMPGRVPPTAPAAARGITGAVRERVRAACVVAAGPPLRQDTGNAPAARLLRACPRGSWSKKRRGRGVEA